MLKRIAFDFDDTLVDLAGRSFSYLNRRFPDVLKNPDAKREDYVQAPWIIFNLNREQYLGVLNDFAFSDEFISTAEPLPGAVESLKELENKGYKDPVVVSARPKYVIHNSIKRDMKERMQMVLDKCYPGIFSEVYNTDHFGSKIVECKKLDCLGLIDDMPRSFSDILEHKNFIGVLLGDRIWNRDNENYNAIESGVNRANDWSHVPKYF